MLTEFLILLPLPPDCLDCKHELLHPFNAVLRVELSPLSTLGFCCILYLIPMFMFFLETLLPADTCWPRVPGMLMGGESTNVTGLWEPILAGAMCPYVR